MKETDVRKKLKMADILVKMTYVSLCQSDRRILRKNKHSDIAKNPVVLGHEGGGYIIDPGNQEDMLQPGDKVVILPHITCAKHACQSCNSFTQNLCPDMKHIGFHENGILAQLMNFSLQSVLQVPQSFPDKALPLVEPLACVIRALFHIKEHLTKLQHDTVNLGTDDYFTIYGAGPMGSLAALAVKRFWPGVKVKMADPIEARRLLVSDNGIADKAVPGVTQQHRISFVASSNLQADIDAVSNTEYGGVVLLFSGINTEDLNSDEAVLWERIHRRELVETRTNPLNNERYRLVGSSGYNFDDARRSEKELQKHYDHYAIVQNVEIEGLDATQAHYITPVDEWCRFPNAVEALLAPLGVNDPEYGEAIAKSHKVLIRL